MERIHSRFLSLMFTMSHRGLLLRDRYNGLFAAQLKAFPYAAQRFVMRSGERGLDAVYVQSDGDGPTLVLCHGIGETVEYWSGVQSLLRQEGISSLIFNYTGFGASPGRACVDFCEKDAIAAVEEVFRRGRKDVFLLGFSLGTGVAVASALQIKVRGVVLCQGFSSLQEAAVAAKFPRWMTMSANDVWQIEGCVGELNVPVLVVHSRDDSLFPLSMAERVAKACVKGEMIALSGLQHNEPLLAAPASYWLPIVEWMRRELIES